MIADLGFCGRCVNRLRQLIGFLQAFRKLNPTDCAIFLVACPSAACDISTHDTLNRNHLQLSAHHAVTIKFFLLEKFRHIFYINGNHVVRKNIFCHIEPEFRHLCKNCSFFGNHIVQNHIEATDTICRYHDQAVPIVINLTYFTFFDRL